MAAISKEKNKEILILIKDANGMFSQRPCDICDSKQLTRHICIFEYSNKTAIAIHNGKYFCGADFCAGCALKWGSEKRNICGYYQGLDPKKLFEKRSLSPSESFNIKETEKSDPRLFPRITNDDDESNFSNIESDSSIEEVNSVDYVKLKMMFELIDLSSEEKYQDQRFSFIEEIKKLRIFPF